MSAQPDLTTATLLLRPFRISDADRVAELLNDPEVSRNLRSVEFPYSVDDATKWLESLPKEWQQGQSAVFAICPRGSGEPGDQSNLLTGAVGVVIDQQSNRGELGFWIGKPYWGQGIATQASFAVLDFAFGQIGLARVYAECLDQNVASARVLEKLGMKQEGLLEQHFRKYEGENFSDVRVYGLLRNVWNERQ